MATNKVVKGVGNDLKGLVGGNTISSLFGSSETKKDPYAWYKRNPVTTYEALQKGLNPKKYAKYKPVFDLADQYEAEWAKANEANEARYQQGLVQLKALEKMYADFNPELPKEDAYEYGKAQRAQIEKDRVRGTAQGMQNLMNSGLANTTLANSVTAAYANQATLQNLELDDAIQRYRQERADKIYDLKLGLAQQKLQNLANVYSNRLEWIGSKVDQGPDAGYFGAMVPFYAKYAKGLTADKSARNLKQITPALQKQGINYQ